MSDYFTLFFQISGIKSLDFGPQIKCKGAHGFVSRGFSSLYVKISIFTLPSSTFAFDLEVYENKLTLRRKHKHQYLEWFRPYRPCLLGLINWHNYLNPTPWEALMGRLIAGMGTGHTYEKLLRNTE